MTPPTPPTDNPCPWESLPLSQAPSGSRVRILAFGRVPAERADYLMAYGCAPGREVRVLQQVPVTVLQLEGTELALENELAREIVVALTSRPPRHRRGWRWRLGQRRGGRRRG